MSVEKWWNEICDRGEREKPREKPTQTPFLYTGCKRYRLPKKMGDTFQSTYQKYLIQFFLSRTLIFMF